MDENNKQLEIAHCMYEVNRLFLKNKNTDLPDWHELSDQYKTYWIVLADAAIECMQEMDTPMMKAALKAYQKPTIVNNGEGWEQVRTREFLKVFNAVMDAAKIDWTKRLSAPKK